jgi:hypothetical protein
MGGAYKTPTPMKPNRPSFTDDHPPYPLFFCQAFGLTIASVLPLPELLPAAGAADVTISYGAVPDELESVEQRGVCFQANSAAFLLKLKRVAKYLVTAGERIVIERVPGVQDQEVRLFLLGSAMAALLQQRGLLPLHGCAVAVNRGAAVFVGFSGCGKSTLAGALRQRGYRVMADDICVLSFAPRGEPLILAAYPQLKLWGDAVKILEERREELPRVRDGLEKFGLPLEGGFVNNSLPLTRIYELTTSNSQDFKLVSLQGADRLAILINHTYRLRFLTGASGRKRHFEQCRQAASHCRVSRVVRPRHPFRLKELADLVEQDWA